MQPSNRITYRFDRSGNKIDEPFTLPAEPDMKQERKLSLVPPPQVIAAEEKIVEEDVELYGLDIERLEQLIRNSQLEKQEVEKAEASIDQRKPNSDIDMVNNDSSSESVSYMKQIANDEEQEEEYEPFLESYSYEQNDSILEQDQPLIADENNYIYESRTVKKLTWTTSLITVLSAVATGMLLGYLLLVQVFGTLWWQPSTQAASIPTVEEQPIAIPTAPASEGETSATIIDTSQEHFSYQLLQAGVFTQENTRDETIAALKKAGYAAQYTKSSNGKYYVYAALTTSAINSEPYKSAVSGFELYRKELLLQMPATLQYNGESELLNSYFSESNALIAMYADLVAVQIEQTSFSAIGSSAQEAMEQKYGQWDTLANEVMEGFKQTNGEQYAIELHKALKDAQAQMLAYQKQPSQKSIWEVQSAIVHAVLLQKEWFEQLS